MKSFEFSKIIMMFVGAVAFIVTAFTMYMVYETKDLSPLVYLIPSWFTLLTTATGFYYYKARKENEIKLRKKYGAEIYNDVKGETMNGQDY